jgi:rRNA processing protein Krr1/Pno1
MVPDRTVGLIIGRGGETIRDLQERSGCHINIVGESKSVNGLRPVNLIGTREAATRAKDAIMEIVDSDSRGEATGSRAGGGRPPMGGRDDAQSRPAAGGHYGGGGGDKITESVYVPSDAVGMIIGKGGETIREMQNGTGCKINVQQGQPGETEREITLIGSRDSIAQAKQAIEEKVDAVVRIIRESPEQDRMLTIMSSGRRAAAAAAVAVVAVGDTRIRIVAATQTKALPPALTLNLQQRPVMKQILTPNVSIIVILAILDSC